MLFTFDYNFPTEWSGEMWSGIVELVF